MTTAHGARGGLAGAEHGFFVALSVDRLPAGGGAGGGRAPRRRGARRGTNAPPPSEQPSESARHPDPPRFDDRPSAPAINDPIAKKIMDKIEEKSKPPEPPEDKSISTIFLGGITEEMTEEMVAE